MKRACISSRTGPNLWEFPATASGGAHLYTTSFYPTKNMGALGDGGAVFTEDEELATRVREMTRHGGLLRDHYVRVGTTARLDTLQAAILRIKLAHLAPWTAMRRTLASWYLRDLKSLTSLGLELPSEDHDPLAHVWALFTVRLPKVRQAVIERLRSNDIGSGIYYSTPLHRQPALKAFAKVPCPNAERLCEEVLSLPLYPELSGQEVGAVAKILRECLQRI